jgi:hypothetical protein
MTMLESRSHMPKTSAAIKALAAERAALAQRADYTHKHNTPIGRHGWLRLTPAYSLKIVDELLSHAAPQHRIFDPFCGTATTALCAASRGHDATTTELNEFLVWFGKAKTARYDLRVIHDAKTEAQRIVDDLLSGCGPMADAPAIHNIERWWNPFALTFLRKVKGGIDASKVGTQARDLLLIAFCRTLIALSNAAFNHQSMSFRSESDQPSLLEDVSDMDRAGGYARDVAHVLDSATQNPVGRAVILQSDARTLIGLSAHGLFDLVITSPPYPNRMSYIRELRPYMYWLGFLTDQKAAGDIDWVAIGGTWGAATSRLKDWVRAGKGFCPAYFRNILAEINAKANANGGLLSNYVEKYFEDMFQHLGTLRASLAPGARVHYIIGNSTFYQVLVPVERLYADMFTALDFRDVNIRAVRKRNSKKELIEFDVSAVWPG